ncbi:ABC transporter permease [Rhodospirillum rubrum]|uniref:ABC transporter permease n=1 Tax=Rhodospirillum rubrum TaxID=1085 RepID=UPI001907EDC0|nr:ABC transporter permease [Rhodospirillum rubrum]MBK1665461.1 ABC transporter permease [Rhodospirillum rubrum]MBK1678154.1 ABC transporter permease [Rhodospirillum rubrum]
MIAGAWRYLPRIAFAELRGEWPVAIAICLAIMAVTAPLLVLGGLHNGVIGGILSGLRNDPGARLIRLQATGASRFDAAWFAEVGSLPEVGFIAPATRWAATQAAILDVTGAKEQQASLLPTAGADPVFDASTPPLAGPLQARLSADLARGLGVGTGDSVLIEITRKIKDREERASVTLEVTAVAPPANFARNAAFISLDLLGQIEDFKDGFAAPLLGKTGTAAKPRAHYPDFRLYARSVEEVRPLMARLAAPPYGLSLQAETDRIDFALALDRDLALVVSAVGGLGAFGLMGGVAAIQWSMAARRRRTIAILGLIGFGKSTLIGLPVIQAALVGLMGAIASLGAALAFQALINHKLAATVFAHAQGVPCAITLPLALAALGGILVLSIAPALGIGIHYAALEPANEIRET